ncbi:MAG TPA: sodium-dependent bicarbonate transport family permease [Sediminibacterium sp.]|uniref:sodium-dependent bicarbonate transport family permease n=1 Tax=Sediminibacterium sp. TaxID=1917865 RepID=UPI0008CB8810|nr:sodium-dependent bicarbonate transport family permease [Sediminibacterium sp.]OHC85739.1 MAG: sodium-dependent bicarbonate transport family permease [Sphingobacteriia bacterium RIFOXYC2_FULL_35_18]OHC87275.1 MAG: sodium-dependent bicarbonate transport family permease [Sphingobacteriia bacterium RIFOXYD2_FULL_35_12]HLD52615.1 sodium-dependent bicarbonate transport family permease [Sediminibacterium sp.]
MNYNLLLDNLTNPALLFFVLGILAVYLKSDLEIPPNSSKFISLYLLFAIGFKGGQELSHESFNSEIAWSMLFGVGISVFIPLYTFFILKKRLNIYNAGAIAAAYGSVSAVTFVTAVTYLEAQQFNVHGYMVAIMALMESPAIIVGLLMISLFDKEEVSDIKKRTVIKHSFTNGSVLLILGSLLIGFVANAKQAEGIKPFTNDLFKGFLAIFLLDMGITSGKKLKAFFSFGVFPFLFAFLIPLINGSFFAWASAFVTDDITNRFMFAILAASASYIAVPAAMKISVPKANPGLFLPMALAITFPVNITIGMPLYFFIAQTT